MEISDGACGYLELVGRVFGAWHTTLACSGGLLWLCPSQTTEAPSLCFALCKLEEELSAPVEKTSLGGKTCTI